MATIDHGRLLADIAALCKARCTAKIKVEVALLDGCIELALLGQESPWGAYVAVWDALTDDVDAYLQHHGWQFERGEWSLSWDGGAVAEWIITSTSA